MIVFSDFDNTLHPYSDDVAFARNLEHVKKFRQSGNLFCLATGRNRASLKRVWPEYGNYLDYVIFDNGATCMNKHGDIMFEETISLTVAQEIVNRILTKLIDKNLAFVFYHDSMEWAELDQDVTKVRCWVPDVATAQQVTDEVGTNFSNEVQCFIARNSTMSGIKWIKNPEAYRAFVDIMSVDAGKYNAIHRLCESFPHERIITVGDDTNDLAMIKKYNGYAMRNSAPEILEIVHPAQIVDSVAELLEKYE